MNTENITNTTPEAATTDPVENGDKADGKMFTQDELNAIIRDRLARERAKAEPPANDREQAISAREARLDCREYISSNGYPAALLDVFDTTKAEGFKESVEKLAKAFPQITGQEPPKPWGMRQGGTISSSAAIADAFKPKIR